MASSIAAFAAVHGCAAVEPPRKKRTTASESWWRPGGGAGPRLDEPLHATDLVVVGHEDAAPGAALEKLHEASRGCFLGMAVEHDRGHEQDRASHGGAGGVSREPGANRLGDRVRDIGGPGTGAKPDDCGHLRLVLLASREGAARHPREPG